MTAKKFISKAEDEICLLLMNLNESTRKTRRTCQGLWITGGLNKGNSITITYREACNKCVDCKGDKKDK